MHVKLIEAHATNYRNIIDADPFEIGQTTCLVGKNEAGKSAFLKALEGIRSTDPAFTDYGKITNYPRRMFADYKSEHGDDEARVMLTRWKLEPADIQAVAADLGDGALAGDVIVVEKTYEQKSSSWTLPFSAENALEHLIAEHCLTQDDRGTADTTQKAAESLGSLGTRTEAQQALLDAIDGFRGKSAKLHTTDILSAWDAEVHVLLALRQDEWRAFDQQAQRRAATWSGDVERGPRVPRFPGV